MANSMESTLTWKTGMAFDVELEGHSFPIDADPEFGGQGYGPKPKGLVLSALAGCMAMDVASMLAKMRQEPETLKVHAEGSLNETHPKTLDDIVVTFEVTGEVAAKKLWKAIALSRDRYCGVGAMLRKHTTVDVVVVLNGEQQPEEQKAS